MSKPDPEKFCPLPFANVGFDPDGHAFACCWNQKYKLGKIKEVGWEGVWNGEPIKKLRREFLEGKPTTCADQMRHIGCHRLNRHLIQRIELAEHQSSFPIKLDLRLNGRCNLKCTMCEVWTQPNGTFDDSEFWTRGPKEVFPYLKEVDILGGEPFVQKDTFRLIEEVSRVNPYCLWAFVTNGQWKYPGIIQNTLESIAIRWMQISLDSLDPGMYAHIRVGGRLARALENLDHMMDLREKRPALGLSVSFCITRENWEEIPQFIEFAEKRDLRLSLQFAYTPDHLSLLATSPETKKGVLKMLDRFEHSATEEIRGPLLDSLAHPVPEPPEQASELQM